MDWHDSCTASFHVTGLILAESTCHPRCGGSVSLLEALIQPRGMPSSLRFPTHQRPDAHHIMSLGSSARA